MPIEVVEAAVQATAIDGYRLSIQSGHCGAIGALKFDVEVASGQRQRSYSDIVSILAASKLSLNVRALAERIFLRLAEAEAAVHRTTIESVHFHEVGAVDSIVDIVGAAACLDYLGAEIWVSPLPLGRGFIACQHGRIPLPAPATVGCLVGLKTYDAKLESELVTPTAAAILGTVAKGSSEWPTMAPKCVGWGAGTRVLPDRPNVLRVVLGDLPCSEVDDEDTEQVVLEANLDDSTGELIGHCLSRLMQAGALDVWSVPTTMKKGRPGHVLSALVATADASRISALLLQESTSLGVRCHRVSRMVRARRMIEVSTRYGCVPVKVSEGPFGPPQLKPEFDTCVRLADEQRLAVREVVAEAVTQARRVVIRDDGYEK